MKINKLDLTLGLLLVVLTALSVTGVLDSQAQRLTERAFTRSLVAFAAARGLNGVISVAQGTEFALQPAGIGVNFTPGQILDPVNDLVERFSWVMLAASTSLGIQQLLIAISSSTLFAFSVGAFFLVAAYFVVARRRLLPLTRNRVIKTALVLLVLRFGIALLSLGSELVFQSFLTERYDTAYAQLQNSTDKIEKLNQEEQKTIKSNASADTSWLSILRAKASQVSAAFDFSAKLEAYKTQAGELSRSTIELVVIFLFQTILLPLVFLSVLVSLMKSFVRW